MTLSLIARFSTGTAIGIVVRNSTYYYGLEPTRIQLQQIATEVASHKFGSFAAPLIGNQVGLLLATPVTLLYGEMAAFAVKKLVFTIYALVQSIFHELPESIPSPPMLRDIALNIASFAAGFFAKTYFCNYAMPYVGVLLRHLIVFSTPVIGLSLPMLFMAPAFVVMATPGVTFFIGDFISFATSNATYSLLSIGARALFDTKGESRLSIIAL